MGRRVVWLAGMGLLMVGGCGAPPVAGGPGAPEQPTTGGVADRPAPEIADAPAAKPQHLADAEEFVKEVGPYGTVYVRGGRKVIWPGIKGGPMCRTDCSGFCNELLTHSQGYGPEDFAAWFGAKRPLAKDWFATMTAERGFTKIERVADLRPGDFLAVKFPPGGEVTGHCMLVGSTPQPQAASAPTVAGLTQFTVTVIDASKSPHGEGDTRHRALKPRPPRDPNQIEQVDMAIEPVEGPPAGSAPIDASGLGQGTLRLYADRDGKLAGYTWSLAKESKFKAAGEYAIVGGRLVNGFDPRKLPAAAKADEENPGD